MSKHVLPSGGGKALMNTEDSVLLLLDHQSGLFQTVKDITVAELRANVCALARIATLLKVPVILTASVPDGPNGPLMPETAKLAPHAVYVPRQGEVNAWDNDLFVKTVILGTPAGRSLGPSAEKAVPSLPVFWSNPRLSDAVHEKEMAPGGESSGLFSELTLTRVVASAVS